MFTALRPRTRRRGGRRRPWLVAAMVSSVVCVSLAPGAATAAAGPAGDDGAVTILIAGDIATCSGSGDTATADILENAEGIVMTAGDNVYPSGTARQYRDCYGPTWGRFRSRTRPALGNHDWRTGNTDAYFDYFGAQAGPKGRGYYAFDAGPWRVYVLDSMRCFRGRGAQPGVSGCDDTTAQYRWLRQDLKARPRACVLGVWHHPRFSSGPHGNTAKPRPLLRLLYRYGADVVVNGHDHLYERFAPYRPDGTPDDVSGIRHFTVGTGGAGLYALGDRHARNSMVRYNAGHGVLRLVLSDGTYAWSFLAASGRVFTDEGSGTCHEPPA